MKALYYSKLSNKQLQCTLCSHNCKLKDGQTGICRVRTNINGELIAKTYNAYSAVGFDPIEKKPLYHFFPGREILSVGSFGCNMRCSWCQNCEISQTGIDSSNSIRTLEADELLNLAINNKNNIGIAYTYNEPSIAFETNIAVAKLFRENALKNVMVSNAYINHEVLTEYLKYIDAFNIDIKAFEPYMHKKYTGAKLEIVLRNAKAIYSSGAHLELSFLVVPQVNDSEKEFKKFVNWIKNELSKEVPLHISRYFPRNKYHEPPTNSQVLENFASIAKKELDYVYLGNINSNIYQNTSCPVCNSDIIKRNGYLIQISRDSDKGVCEKCGEKIFKME